MTVRISAVAVLLACAVDATVASPIVVWSTVGLQDHTNVVDFESQGTLARNATVRDQFAAEGVVFDGTLRANSCDYNHSVWRHYGINGNSLNTFGPNCQTNSLIDRFSISFDHDVESVSLNVYQAMSARTSTFELLNDGVVIGSYLSSAIPYVGLTSSTAQINGRIFANSSNLRAGFLSFESNGKSFDEIRFTENAPAGQQYLVMDDLRYRTAHNVPEPGTVLLVATAAAGLCWSAHRRRRDV